MADLLAVRFAARAAAAPSALAVVDRMGPTTYGALADRVARAAAAVAGAGRVAILPRGDAASLAVVLGAMTAGTSVVLLDRHLSAAQARRVLDVARPSRIVGSGRLPPALAGQAITAPEELLVGATTLDRSDAAFDVRPGDVLSASGPLDPGHFFYGALHALTRGATADLRPLADAFADRAAEHVYLVPTVAVDLAELLGDTPRDRTRQVVSSAAPWPDPARERLQRLLPHATITHFYGASELSYVTQGTRAFPGVEIEIRGDDGTRLPDGEQGEVHARSDMLFSGYLTPEGRTGGPDAGGWCTVGDLGTLRDGALELAGRGSETIITGGFKVEPAHVERALGGLAGVADAACIGLPDARWGAVPVAVLVLEPGAPAPGRAALRDRARAELPQPSRPRRFFVAEALARSPRGKLRRAELAALVAEGAARELR